MCPIWTPSLRFDAAVRHVANADAEGVYIDGSLWNRETPKSIWMRHIEFPTADDVSDEDRLFVTEQWKVFQKNFLDLGDDLSDTFWVNEPAAADAAESKLVQLRLAQKIGLLFPDAIITNDASAVSRLLNKHKKIIFKQFQGHMWKSRSTGELRSCGPVLLDYGSQLPENAIGVCPGIYQRYIDKIFDVRVTIIGDHVFAIRLWRKNHTAYVDWRPHIYDDDMLVEEFSLPEGVLCKLRMLMLQLKLTYGCIDLVADKNGELFFLEVNQQGQFLFVEEAVPQFRLLQAMTCMFIQGRRDYSLTSNVEVHFEDFLRSDEYQRLQDAPQIPWKFYVSEA
jgi:glutathione synthase/RimK-type ligase-like ATP-grasp enzyme